MHAAGAAEGRPVTPAGGQWLWRLRCGLRLSTVDGDAATDSPTTWVAAPSGSASASVARMSLTRHRVLLLVRARRRRSFSAETWNQQGFPFDTPLVPSRALPCDAAEILCLLQVRCALFGNLDMLRRTGPCVRVSRILDLQLSKY